MSLTARQRGQQAEDVACHHLQAQGLELYDRNYRCRRGEIDLVMGDNETLVFIEVRYRTSSRFGTGAETVGPRKQARIITAAAHYLQTNPGQSRRPARFDVVFMESENTIQWIKDAFQT